MVLAPSFPVLSANCFCFGSAKDENEVALCVEELNAPSFYPSVVSLWVNDSFERKDMERELLAKLFVSLYSGRRNLLTKQQFIDGYVFFSYFVISPFSVQQVLFSD